MKRTLILYRSHTGYTKKYAEWLQKELEAELLPASALKSGLLDSYDTVIFGGSIHASMISGLSRLKKLLPDPSGKRLYIFGVGISAVSDPELAEKTRSEIRNGNLTDAYRNVPFFLLPGGCDIAKTGFFARAILRMLAKSVAKKAESERTEADERMLALVKGPVDWTDPAALCPLLNELQKSGE